MKPAQVSSSNSAPSSASKATSSEGKAPVVPEEPVHEPMEVEEDTDAAAKKEAEELKAKGNVAYKGKKFDEAVQFYEKAWDVWPKDVAFLTNLSGT